MGRPKPGPGPRAGRPLPGPQPGQMPGPGPRAGRSRRAVAALVDEATSSVQNYIVLFAALHYLSVADIGRFTLAYTTVTLVEIVLKSYVLTSLTVHFAASDARDQRRAGADAAAAGLYAGAVTLGVIAALGAIAGPRTGRRSSPRASPLSRSSRKRCGGRTSSRSGGRGRRSRTTPPACWRPSPSSGTPCTGTRRAPRRISCCCSRPAPASASSSAWPRPGSCRRPPVGCAGCARTPRWGSGWPARAARRRWPAGSRS